jgi:hypothetical protein
MTQPIYLLHEFGRYVKASKDQNTCITKYVHTIGLHPKTPVVLNVPVCLRPVFGFFKDKKDAGGKDASTARLRSALGRRAAPPAGFAGGLENDE